MPRKDVDLMRDARLLVADDNITMQRLLRTQLCANGFDVMTVTNGPDAIRAVADYGPNLLLMEACIAGSNGLDVCRQIREWSSLPIIFLSSLDAPKTRTAALDLGADDYITKPFYVGELIARVRAVLRRAGSRAATRPPIVSIGDLTVDSLRREVRCGDRLEHLTKTEFDLLHEFVNNADRVLTYQHLIDAVWGVGYDDRRLVQVHVSNLRRKIEQQDEQRYIVALPGVGYRFAVDSGYYGQL